MESHYVGWLIEIFFGIVIAWLLRKALAKLDSIGTISFKTNLCFLELVERKPEYSKILQEFERTQKGK